MANTASLTKRAMITKANSRMVVVTAVAAFVIVFCGVASKSLYARFSYQSRVISTDKTTLGTLQADLSATNTLVASYNAFNSGTQNVLGGNPSGTGSQDGNNAQVITHALPYQYDFPALTSSIEKLVENAGLKITSITGTDESLAQTTQNTSSAPTPQPIPFQVSVSGSYGAIQTFVNELERSIRPMQVQTIDLSGTQGNMNAVLSVQTFYQPGKTLNIKTEVVK